ncbi:hypothetical protein NL527_29200, partial [Klebsiella pneumoniae]|nr:hypothetical protein [Klebsiella pneumoniae]
PSAVAGMVGAHRVCPREAYLQLQGPTELQLQPATHLVWAPGGGMVPEEEMAQYLAKGCSSLAQQRPQRLWWPLLSSQV